MRIKLSDFQGSNLLNRPEEFTMSSQTLYKIKTISDGGDEKSTEWENWEETKKSFNTCVALWIAAMVMSNHRLT